MTPTIPSVARSGPVRSPIRLRERGYLRVLCPKFAIINSRNLVVASGSMMRVPPVPPFRPACALPPSGSAPQSGRPPVVRPCRTEDVTHCDLRRVPGGRDL
ncbi:hypothetical protein GCM10010448_64300 [Streptomyces glomeratus]|uniref:Uncharacterized protein n=1 Tax=Streptomyces glomeratus TaxID=284452 RepID=A0ABP6M5L9_9ACTN